jgi:hypothetical protein
MCQAGHAQSFPRRPAGSHLIFAEAYPMCRLMRSLFVVVLLLVPALPLKGSAGGKGEQYAFLVGCSKYKKTEFRELPYTGNDVLGFRDALLATGIAQDHIVVLHDATKNPNRYLPNKANILNELDLTLDGLRDEDTVVVALSGHGVQFKGDPVSYFVPVDGKVDDKSTLIALDGPKGLYAQLKACKAKKKLLIVNACRNDPAVNVDFAGKKVELVDEDRDEVPEGVAALYSCQAGQKSYYDPERKLALFFDHVIRAWKGEYAKNGQVTLEGFFEAVVVKTRVDANKTLGVKQTPLVVRDYKGEWVIAKAAKKAEPKVAAKANLLTTLLLGYQGTVNINGCKPGEDAYGISGITEGGVFTIALVDTVRVYGKEAGEVATWPAFFKKLQEVTKKTFDDHMLKEEKPRTQTPYSFGDLATKVSEYQHDEAKDGTSHKVCAVVILDDNDKDNAGAIISDCNQIRSLLQILETGQIREVKYLTGNQVNRDTILNTIRSIALGPKDVLFVYYSGHGGCEPNEKGNEGQGHYFGLYKDKGKVTRTEVMEAMNSRQAVLKVLITDTCFVDAQPRKKT